MSVCHVFLRSGSLRQNSLALSISFLRGSWDRARQKPSFVLSELLACLQEIAFCSAELLQGGFQNPCLQLGAQPEPLGLGGAGLGSWGEHWCQHTNGWLSSCSADTNQVQPPEEGAEKWTLQVCQVLWLLSFPAASLWAASVNGAATAGEIEGTWPVRCSNFVPTYYLLLFFLLLFHFFSKQLLFQLYLLAFFSLYRCKGRG